MKLILVLQSRLNSRLVVLYGNSVGAAITEGLLFAVVMLLKTNIELYAEQKRLLMITSFMCAVFLQYWAGRMEKKL
jgi:hypothetical protein